MARKVILVHVDDLDGTPADRKVSFGIDGVDYEIDLSTANAARLTKILAPYIAKGRSQVRKGRSTSTGPNDARSGQCFQHPSMGGPERIFTTKPGATFRGDTRSP